MANIGKQPSAVTVRFLPQSATPTNPNEGDLFYSDGTVLDLGLWSYTNSAWAQVSTGSTLSTLANLTLTPQSSDPGSPAEGMLFMSNGTPRAEGLWIYTDSAWVQITGVKYAEFYFKSPVRVRLATTAAITLASQLESGDTIDGTVLATSDLVLVKNQTTASENGVYVVAASGPPTRYTGADTFAELNSFIAYVTAGTANKNKVYCQTAILTSLSDNQTWLTTGTPFTHVVGPGITEMDVLAVAGGPGGSAGGGGSAATPALAGGSGAAGSGGSEPKIFKIKTTPGETLTITPGMPGLPGLGVANANGSLGSVGGSTTISGGFGTFTVASGLVGNFGLIGTAAGAAGGAASPSTYNLAGSSSTSGAGGDGATSAGTGADAGQDAPDSYELGGAGGVVGSRSGGGGGGGASLGAGGAGTSTVNANATQAANLNLPGYGGGGGGGAGQNFPSATSRVGGDGGLGGNGYVRISWS
jgi:hypothetical protein